MIDPVCMPILKCLIVFFSLSPDFCVIMTNWNLYCITLLSHEQRKIRFFVHNSALGLAYFITYVSTLTNGHFSI